jgi:hypothetical protein
LGAIAVAAAPFLGIALWIALFNVYANSYTGMFVFFMPGPYLLIAGLAVALATRWSRDELVRSTATASLRFYLQTAAACLAIAVLLAIPVALDSGPWSLDHQPRALETVVAAAIGVFGIALALWVAGRAVVASFAVLANR